MRRYFFNIVRGSAFIPDPEGDDLPGDEEAKEHAEIVAREMIEDRHKFNARNIESLMMPARAFHGAVGLGEVGCQTFEESAV